MSRARLARIPLSEDGAPLQFRIRTRAWAVLPAGRGAGQFDGAAARRSARLYAAKRSGRSSDLRGQLRGVLLQLIAERLPDLSEHLHEVAVMARSTGQRMGIAGEDLEIMVRAAELHDLGKIAVADAMLLTPNSLEPRERAIVGRHCEVGERILAAAPAMVAVAELVRASHERYEEAATQIVARARTSRWGLGSSQCVTPSTR